MSRVRAPVEVPEHIVERVRTLCLALPEVTMRVDGWAQSFDIRRRSFCLLMARQGPTGKPVPSLEQKTGGRKLPPLRRSTPVCIRFPYRAQPAAWRYERLDEQLITQHTGRPENPLVVKSVQLA